MIELENKYCLFTSIDTGLSETTIDICDLHLLDIIKAKKFLIKIDFNNLDPKKYKKKLKKFLHFKKFYKRKIGTIKEEKIILGYVLNYDEGNNQQKDFLLAINACLYNTRAERYNYIYDTVCNYLDEFFYGKNLCDFKNNKCGEKQGTSSNIGCCHHYKNKLLGPLIKNNLVPCEHLRADHTCGAKCISCKLFTCDYLERKGIKFKIKDILLLDVFFNPLQKYFIKYMVFTPKEKIIKRLKML